MRLSGYNIYSPVAQQIKPVTTEPFHGVFESYKNNNCTLPKLKENEGFFACLERSLNAISHKQVKSKEAVSSLLTATTGEAAEFAIDILKETP